MIEFGRQDFLLLLRALALGDVEGHALEAYKPPSSVKLALRCFLGPYLTAVETYKPKTDRSRRIVWIEAAPHLLHAPKVVWMDSSNEGRVIEGLLRIVPQKLCGVVAAPYQIGGHIPLERYDPPSSQRLLQAPLRVQPARDLLFQARGQFMHV